jgi:hypothetical protein
VLSKAIWNVVKKPLNAAAASVTNHHACKQRNSTETNKIHLVLFCMQGRKFYPYLADINGMFISVMKMTYSVSGTKAGLTQTEDHLRPCTASSA